MYKKKKSKNYHFGTATTSSCVCFFWKDRKWLYKLLLRSRYENAAPNLCWVFCEINNGCLFRECICVDTHLLRFEAIAYELLHIDVLTHVVIRVFSAFIFSCFLRSAICLCNAYIFQEFPSSCLLKMCATAGACIDETELFSSAAVVPQRKFTELCSLAAVVPHKGRLPSCVVGRGPLSHKVSLPRCEARRRHFIMTCDILGTGQTNISALCYLFGKNLYTSLK